MTPSGQKIQVLYSQAYSLDDITQEALAFCSKSKEQAESLTDYITENEGVKTKIYKITIEEL